MADTDTLEAKRAGVTAALENLRMSPDIAGLVQQADQAVRNFKAEAGILEDQISDLDREIGARARHQRAEAEQTRLEQLGAQRTQLAEMADERREAVAAAQAGARQLAAALGRLLDVNAG